MSYPGYPGQNPYSHQHPQQPYQQPNMGYQPYQQGGGYQQPYQPQQGYQPPPPSYGVPPSYQQQQPPQPYQPYTPPSQPQPQQQGYQYQPYQQPPSQPPQPHQQNLSTAYQPPSTPSLPQPTRQLTELTVAAVKEFRRFQDVLAAVRDVALTHRLSYDESARAFNDIAVACWDTQMFGVKVTQYVSNTGESSNLLTLRGILPIVFRGRQYQTPVEIFVPLQYPQRPPIPYVVPSSDMRVVPNNPYVSPDRLVNIDYLRDWKPTSSFAQMLAMMSSAFSQRPPLYAVQPGTPAAASTTTTITPSTSTYPQNQVSPSQTPPSSAYGGGPRTSFSDANASSYHSTNSHHSNPPSYQPQPSKDTHTSPSNDYIPFQVPSNEADRRNVLQQIVEIKLAAAQSTQYKELSKKLNEMNQEKRELSSQQFTLAHSVKAKADMLDELKRIDKLLDDDIANAKKSIEEQRNLLQNNNTTDEDGNQVFDFEKLIHFDGLSLQAVKEVACDRAYDDVLTQLDAFLSGGQITIETYLKEVRIYSRRQFMSRALATKINEAM